MKAAIPVVMSLLTVGACLWGAIESAKHDPPHPITHYRELNPRLTTDGFNIFAESQLAVEIPLENESPALVYNAYDYSKLIIKSPKGETVRKADAIYDDLWHSPTQSLFFIQNDGPNSRVWRWSNQNGFESITKAFPHLSRLTLSRDGKFAAVRTDSMEYRIDAKSAEYTIIEVSTKQTEDVSLMPTCENFVPISATDGYVDFSEASTMHWTASGTSRTEFPAGNLVGIAMASGYCYGLVKEKQKYQVVQLDEKMKVVKSLATYPIGLRPIPNDSSD